MMKKALPIGPLMTIAGIIAIVIGGAAWQKDADPWSGGILGPKDVPQIVRNAPRYATVVSLADEMDALIGQLDALSHGEPLDIQNNQGNRP